MDNALDPFAPLSEAELSEGARESAHAQNAREARPTCPPDGAEPGDVAAARLFGRKPDHFWRYTTAVDETAFYAARWNGPDGKKTFRPVSYFDESWQLTAWPDHRPLYRLPELAADPKAPVVICEGEKAADAAAAIFPQSIVTTSSGGAGAAVKTDWTALAGRRILIWPDNDAAGRKYAEQVAHILAPLDCVVSIIDAAALASLDANGGAHEPVEKWDAADAAAEWPDLHALRKAAHSLAKPFDAGAGKADIPPKSPNRGIAPAYTKGLVALTAADLLQHEFPPQEVILAPWLPEKGLTLAFAERGIGKTWIALNVAYAVASGGGYLRWRAPRARRVVYIDGEMPGLALKERLAVIVKYSSHEAPDDFLTFVAADMQPDGLPDLASPDGQRFYDDVIKNADLIVVDNLSTICRGLRENEADPWGPVQEWCLRQRAAGKSVLLVHHAGKGGAQRGTSRKEDVLDTVVALRRPADYVASQGARFEVHFTKSRGFYGDDAEPFEAHLVGGQWTISEITPTDSNEALIAFREQGLSVREIAERTGVPRSTVSRKLKRGGER